MKNLIQPLRRLSILVTAALLSILTACQPIKQQPDNMDSRVDDLLARMTLEEKIGQLNQFSNPYQQTGTGEASEHNESFDEMVAAGQIGSFLNVLGVDETMRLQKIAVEESRLGIPLLFAYDVIHGYRTMFPIPLGEAASFDRLAIEQSARIAAVEASANGLHWTFAPMVDISRDARWGRIMEGAGEDVYLGEQAAMARVRGFQGEDLTSNNTLAACAKHFAAYGASVGGRDYNMVDMSERMLREVYFPPFKAALDAGVATFMASFNTINGIPSSGDAWLMTEVLREEWGFKGLVVSDWSSIEEMIDHGNVESAYEAGYRGIEAGIDIDMEGRIYIQHVKQLLDDKKVSIQQIDQMVRRILRVKFQLGLFDNPFAYCDKQREDTLTMHPSHLDAARDMARKSIVLMKNDKDVLPITNRYQRIALIGPLAADKDAPLGNWRANATPNSAVSLLEGMRAAAGSDFEILYAEGTKLVTNSQQNFFTQLEYNTTDRSGFPEALDAARRADVVVMALGETAYMSGECRSYADISLKGLQLELLREIKKTGKPVVLALFTGRPLVLTDVVDHTDAIVNCWLVGSESGHAIADVLFGKYNPAGKLPVSFPYHVGQVPVYYERYNTGRPFDPNPLEFSTKYRDIPNEPLFAFGHGLSYTQFEYSMLSLSQDTLGMQESLQIQATVTNTGDMAGEEVIQLYIRDLAGKGIARPLLQLKGFEKVMLQPGESREVHFEIHPGDLAFFRKDNSWGPEAGRFRVFVGTASDQLTLQAEFELTD